MKQYKSSILYFASWNSFTHVGCAYNLAKSMPDVLFHVVTAEKWPFHKLDNVIYHRIFRPNCAMRFSEKFFLHHYPYEKELADINKYRKHFFAYTKWLQQINPNLVIVDTTLEIALLSKFMGYPTCVFYETWDSNNLRHRVTWENVDSILVRYPKEFIEKIEIRISPKMFFSGGVSKFDLYDEMPSKEKSMEVLGLKKGYKEKIITMLSSSQPQAIPQAKRYFRTICSVLNSFEGAKSYVLYPKEDAIIKSLKRKYKNIDFIVGVYNQVNHYLSLSDVVITGAGLGATMESCYFRVPMLLIPVPWAFNEQMVKASALENMGAAKLVSPMTMNESLIRSEIQELLVNQELREKMKEKQRIMIDKRGYKRLSRHLNKMLESRVCQDKSSIKTD